MDVAKSQVALLVRQTDEFLDFFRDEKFFVKGGTGFGDTGRRVRVPVCGGRGFFRWSRDGIVGQKMVRSIWIAEGFGKRFAPFLADARGCRSGLGLRHTTCKSLIFNFPERGSNIEARP